MWGIKTSKLKKNCKYNPLEKGGLNKKRHISMLKVKLYFFSSFLVEVVRFFVTYDLARNKTGSVKNGMTELYKNNNKKTTHTNK